VNTFVLSIIAFLSLLTSLVQVAYRPSLRNGVVVAFDAYLEVTQQIQQSIDVELGHDSPKWHLKNACAACTYVLEDEPHLEPSMLIAIHGNESLKRVERAYHEKTAAGKVISATNIERQDSRSMTNTSDLYLSREAVNRFKNEVQPRKALRSPVVSRKHLYLIYIYYLLFG
jgi:hypothetical protein